jgi:hypothetical protein
MVIVPARPAASCLRVPVNSTLGIAINGSALDRYKQPECGATRPARSPVADAVASRAIESSAGIERSDLKLGAAGAASPRARAGSHPRQATAGEATKQGFTWTPGLLASKVCESVEVGYRLRSDAQRLRLEFYVSGEYKSWHAFVPKQHRVFAIVSALPNPSLELTRYGRRRKPGVRCLRHCRTPGLRHLPPRAAQLER